MSDEAKILAWLAVGIAAFISTAIFLDSVACAAKSVSFDGHDYGPVQGCMVSHNGKWLPLSAIRAIDE